MSSSRMPARKVIYYSIKVEGEFLRCKAVLEKCYSEVKLLQRLSSLNVQFKDACEEGNILLNKDRGRILAM